jgi:hypothetical protein
MEAQNGLCLPGCPSWLSRALSWTIGASNRGRPRGSFALSTGQFGPDPALQLGSKLADLLFWRVWSKLNGQ